MEKHIIHKNENIGEALRRINDLSGGVMTLLVTDPVSGVMLGTLTDGDIRRGLLGGASLYHPVWRIMNTAFSAS